MKLALDHIGFLGEDTLQMVATFRALGFRVSDPARLQSGEGSHGHPGVQSSAHIMFADQYIELTSVNPCPPSHHLAPYRSLEPSIRLLILGTSDIEGTVEQLSREGVPTSSIMTASRKLLYGGKETVRFRWLSIVPDPLPGILSGFVEHLDAAAIFQPAMTDHPNTATGITALHCDAKAVPLALTKGKGSFVELTEPMQDCSDRFFTGADIRIEDLEECERCLRTGGVRYKRVDDVLAVPSSAACGAEIRLGMFG